MGTWTLQHMYCSAFSFTFYYVAGAYLGQADDPVPRLTDKFTVILYVKVTLGNC